MKLLSRYLLLALGAVLIASCQQDPQSANPMMRVTPAGGGSTPAHPAIAFGTSHLVTIHGSRYTYDDIAVMDSDGTHQTTIYTAPDWEGVYTIYYRPTWSPSGGTIAFVQSNSTSRSILARDVSVVNGVATGSNTRTIYSNANIFNTPIAWSSNASTDAIVLVIRPNGSNATTSIVRVSVSTGSATTLYQKVGYNGVFRSPTWSNDDSKIAFIDHTGSNTSGITDTLRVIDASTGTLLASNPIGVSSSSYGNVIEWSRSGMDTLVLGLADNSTVYYVGPMTGATSTNNLAGGMPCWSPNNSSIVSGHPVSGSPSVTQKTQTFSTNSSTIASGIGACVWKR